MGLKNKNKLYSSIHFKEKYLIILLPKTGKFIFLNNEWRLKFISWNYKKLKKNGSIDK